ncbi:MAG: DUF5119 domain-containing protein [Muribaculaceae bacterium]|jgi:hypothetical protein|nr:DUF5119 domain-containing protein [Muribaculaceae bacterium]
MRHLNILYILILLAVAATGCGQKEIYCPGSFDSRVHVAFEWDKAHGADVEGMTLFFFPIDNDGKIWRFDIAGSAGGDIELPDGKYRMIAVNNDLPAISLTGTGSFSTLAAEATATAIDTLLMPTGMVYSAVIDNITVTPCGVTYSDSEGCDKTCPKGLIRCSPDSLSMVYDLYINKVEQPERIRSVSACICGLSDAMILCSESPESDFAATAVSLGVGQGCALSGSTTGFIVCPAAGKCRIELMVKCADGKVLTKSFDVTAQLANSAGTHHVNIYIDEIRLPDFDEDDKEDVGMNVAVDGWNIIEINY